MQALHEWLLRLGDTCSFGHDSNQRERLFRMRPPPRTTCPFFVTSSGCKNGRWCSRRHDFSDADPALVAAAAAAAAPLRPTPSAEAVVSDFVLHQCASISDPLTEPMRFFKSARMLGHGGYATVWLGKYSAADRSEHPCAFKHFYGAYITDLQTRSYNKEVAALKRLQHPNVLPLVGVSADPYVHRCIFQLGPMHSRSDSCCHL